MAILDGTYQPRIPSIGELVSTIKGSNDAIFGRWTIVDSETKDEICTFDTFGGYDASKTASIPSTNIEKGSFTQYNKITNAQEFTVTLIRSGFSWILREMLEKLERYQESTKLVNIELPFKTFLNCNIKDLNHSIKSGQAINTLSVELHLQEIEEVESAYITTEQQLPANKVKNPADATPVKKGRLQSLLFQGKQKLGL